MRPHELLFYIVVDVAPAEQLADPVRATASNTVSLYVVVLDLFVVIGHQHLALFFMVRHGLFSVFVLAKCTMGPLANVITSQVQMVLHVQAGS